jgi:hypothetical protein
MRIAKVEAEKDGCHMQHETTMFAYQPLKAKENKTAISHGPHRSL